MRHLWLGIVIKTQIIIMAFSDTAIERELGEKTPTSSNTDRVINVEYEPRSQIYEFQATHFIVTGYIMCSTKPKLCLNLSAHSLITIFIKRNYSCVHIVLLLFKSADQSLI